MNAISTATRSMSAEATRAADVLEDRAGLLAGRLAHAARLGAAAGDAVAHAEERARAAHEAACAGDAGKGFAVVASEMQTLAADALKAVDELAEGSTSVHLATGGGRAAFAGAEGLFAGLDREVAAADDELQAHAAELARLAEDAEAGAEAGRALCEALAGVAEPVQALTTRTNGVGELARSVAAAAADEAARALRGC